MDKFGQLQVLSLLALLVQKYWYKNKRGRYLIADTDSLMDKFGQLQVPGLLALLVQKYEY